MLLRSRRLTCFYCGRRSGQTFDGIVRQWRCGSCGAVNHLDESGQITEPPSPEVATDDTPPRTQTQYAYAVRRSLSPEFSSAAEDRFATTDPGTKTSHFSPSSHFCPTCLKNQHLLVNALSTYLPDDPSHPQYAEFEASIPTYRAQLEKRYPPVCARCAPEAERRIRDSAYFAKTDHLRRMMERSKRGVMPKAWERSDLWEWGWKAAVVILGGVMWWASLVMQALGNLAGMLLRAGDGDGLVPDDGADTKSFTTGSSCGTGTFGLAKCAISCGFQAAHSGSVESSCYSAALALQYFALILGILAIWWNVRLWEKLMPRGRSGRLGGLKNFFTLQLAILGARAGFWSLLGGEGVLEQGAWKSAERSGWWISEPAWRGAHAFMFVLCGVVSDLAIVESLKC
ncbi:Ima1 N-terminal domain-containing protein [Lineolata rhizophorae]|uniref:Ima1 N-terminal domain-containing protein n=1 Tax=Lineolata rhizophorae TaxID=578093 RepID=A0A6A6PD17_9PEZI|nr:Ima1 N-terminal domain-containing protein [Lineolata rhizophorae]